MNTATSERAERGEASLQPVGELLYRFEADLEITPSGLTPEGIRMTVDYEGEITTGMLQGARVWGTDPLLLRTDGVGVIDTSETRSILGICLSPIHTVPVKGTDRYGVFRL